MKNRRLMVRNGGSRSRKEVREGGDRGEERKEMHLMIGSL